MGRSTAELIFDILIQECQASELWRENFCLLFPRITEYRFQGALGFGGKFWRNDGRWYVSYYREDATPEREAMVERANERLAALKAERGE